MSDDTKRDAKSDLAVCAGATPGPWYYVGDRYVGVAAACDCLPRETITITAGERFEVNRPHESHQIVPILCDGELPDYMTVEQYSANCKRIVQCVNALPHWIERATAAEAEVERLRQYRDNAVAALGDWMEVAGRLWAGCQEGYAYIDHATETRGNGPRERHALASIKAAIDACEATKAKGGTS